MLTILRKVRSSAKIFTVLMLASTGAAVAAAPELTEILASPYRCAENKARDAFRHPQQTLQFFGLQPQHAVLEIWPARGWYTEILAPYLKEQGQLSIANFRLNDGTPGR